jgi:hypothetical protein
MINNPITVIIVTTQVHLPAWTTRRGFRHHSPSDARHASSDLVVWIHWSEAELSPTQRNYDDTEHTCGRQRDKRHIQETRGPFCLNQDGTQGRESRHTK